MSNLKPLLSGALPTVMEFRNILDLGAPPINDLSSDFGQALATLVQKQKGWNSKECGLTLIDLMSPALAKGGIESLLNTPGISREATIMLRANKNATSQPSPACTETRSPQDNRYLAYAMAKYGNLNDPQTAEFIKKHGLAGDMAKSPSTTIEHLLTRKDIPKSLASLLDAATTASEYRILCQMEGHRVFREQFREHMTLTECISMDQELRLPPDLSATNLTFLYKTLITPTGAAMFAFPEREEARIALHPNAPKSILVEAMDRKSPVGHLRTHAAKSDSPHAEWFLRVCGQQWEMGEVKNAAPDALKRAAETSPTSKAEFLPDILSHPNYPWKENNEEILKKVQIIYTETVIAARCLHEADRSKVLSEDLSRRFPASFLFTEKLSARQIEKLVAVHPEYAALAACHPNGYDIQVENEHDRTIVSRYREKFPCPHLPGKTGAHLPEKQTHTLDI